MVGMTVVLLEGVPALQHEVLSEDEEDAAWIDVYKLKNSVFLARKLRMKAFPLGFGKCSRSSTLFAWRQSHNLRHRRQRPGVKDRASKADTTDILCKTSRCTLAPLISTQTSDNINDDE